jgi:hypothetical protein
MLPASTKRRDLPKGYNPFKGIVIAIKDKLGRIFFGEEKISCLHEVL